MKQKGLLLFRYILLKRVTNRNPMDKRLSTQRKNYKGIEKNFFTNMNFIFHEFFP